MARRLAEHRCAQAGHEDKVPELYCLACECMICLKCATSPTGDHRDHRHADLSEVAWGLRQGMRRALQRAHGVATKLGGAVDRADEAVRAVERSKVRDAGRIGEAFDALRQKMEERKHALLAELEAAAQRRVSALEYRKTRVQRLLREVCRCCEATFHALQTHSDQEVVAMESLLPAALSETLRSVEEDLALDPDPMQDGIGVSLEPEKLASGLGSLGEVRDTSAHPPASTWWAYAPVAMAKVPYRIDVTTMTFVGERCRHGGMHVEAELASKVHNGLGTTGRTVDNGDGTYTVTLTPQCDGPHILRVTMDGQLLKGSPLDVDVRGHAKPNYRPQEPPQEVASARAPWCISLHRDGNVFVGSKANCIHVYDRNWGLKYTIGSSGQGDGQFNDLRDLAISGDLLYVADFQNHRVQTLTVGGEFRRKFGELGSGNGQFNGPTALAIDARGRVFVCDSENDRVQAFTADGSWLMSVGGRGGGNATAHVPRGVACDLQGNIYVASYRSACVMVYSPGGILVRMFGNLKRPTQISVDEEGYSFVSEGGGDCLVVFDPQGRRVHTVKGLNNPAGVVLDSKVPCLYVANKGSNAVLKYSL